MSKYARQIFQAMRPVFTDLATEIQRSLGFYKTSNPNTKLSKIIALGGGTKMRGLLKYLQQTVEIPVERPDSFKKLVISSVVSTAKFHESVCDFGIVYGLGLQGLDLGRIESNLLPRGIARSMAWASKARYFTAAAGLILLISVLTFARTLFDKATYSEKADVRRETSRTIDDTRQAINQNQEEIRAGSGYEAMIQKEFEVFNYRDVVPLLVESIISALPNEKNNPEQREFYEAFASGDVDTVLKTPRKERKQLFITSMRTYFVEDVNTATFDSIDEEYRSYSERSQYRSQYTGARGMSGGSAVQQGETGFMVTIVGYSPYKNIDNLLDPAGVEDNPDEWGFITRLTHLDDMVDGNSPFKLYKKTEAKHFNLDSDPVEARGELSGMDTANIFKGIGVEDIRFEKAQMTRDRMIRDSEYDNLGIIVLIDPMTREIISKVAERDEDGKEKLDNRGKPIHTVNDHWFVLNVKFAWKDAPAPPVVAGPATPVDYGRRSGATPMPTGGKTTEKRINLDNL
jgi:hypothetical protein